MGQCVFAVDGQDKCCPSAVGSQCPAPKSHATVRGPLEAGVLQSEMPGMAERTAALRARLDALLDLAEAL